MNKRFTTLLVEDEDLARGRLRRLLEAHGDCIEIVGEAGDGRAGRELIDRLHPELIFLDVQMPGLNGFEMLRELKHQPLVIFTTAFEEFAIKAFEENSLDYLLKPIEPERLRIAIDKLQRLGRSPAPWNNARVYSLLEQLQEKPSLTAIPLRIGDKVLFKKTDDIISFEARDKSVYLTDLAGKEFFVQQSLNSLEQKLPPEFLRVHRSAIVNTRHIVELHKHFKGRWRIMLAGSARKKLTSGANYAEALKRLAEL